MEVYKLQQNDFISIFLYNFIYYEEQNSNIFGPKK